MAYHIGRLAARHFGYEPVDVQMVEPAPAIFEYDTPMPQIKIAEMERAITKDDVLVVNPAFSNHLFGLRLPGRKIMYVQDFRTFLLLDCHCDLYVSVSQLVARYVYALYGITTPVIPPFIEPPPIDAAPWDERPAGSALVYIKSPTREHHMLLQLLQRRLGKVAPQIDLSNVLEGRGLSQPEFFARLASVRYFVNLSLAEGFGLVPLEAMAAGTMVTGVDGLAGRDYMRQGVNSLTASIRDLRGVPIVVQRAFEDEALARECAEGGLRTAALYSHNAFKTAWLNQLSELFGREPDHV